MVSRKRKNKTKSWNARQEKDPYVQMARKEGYRARAVYKLTELDKKYHLIKPDTIVVDLGSAPGSWSQYAASKTKSDNSIVAVDILEMDSIDGVEFIQGDFSDQPIIDAVLDRLDGIKADLVISDMAPNLTGIRSADQARAELMQEIIFEFCQSGLRKGGHLVTKLFEGESAIATRKLAGQRFKQVNTIKPAASRSESREIYLLARGFNPSA